MTKLQKTQWFRAAGIGGLFACLGFSMALATSESRGLGGVECRAISTNFTRPLVVFVTESDLGLVVVGSQFTRQIIVRFGYKPHSFAFGVAKPPSGVVISESGTLSGAIKDAGQTQFDVNVTDTVNGVADTPVTKSFSLTAVPALMEPALPLMFVNDPALPVAVANEPYSFTVHADGGLPPYLIQFASDEDIQALPVGLSLNVSSGLIMGKPVIPSESGIPSSFTLVVTDSIGVSVLQTFTLLVLPGTISSEFVATSGSFKLEFGKEVPKDTLQLTVVLDKTQLGQAMIRDVSDLAGQSFTMDFGGVSLPPSTTATKDTTGTLGTGAAATFDKNGSIRYPSILGGTFPPTSKATYDIKLNPKTGILKAKFTNIDMVMRLGANFKSFGAARSANDLPGPIIPVNIKIGTVKSSTDVTAKATATTKTVSFDKTDIVKFLYTRKGAVGKGTARANSKLAPGGMFLVTKVQGKEVQVSATQDRLLLKASGVLRQIGGRPIAFGTQDNVALLFGDVCLGVFPASSLKRANGRLEFVNEDHIASLHTFIIDNRSGTFYFDTFGVDPKLLFGEDILVAGEALVMPITLTITAPDAANPVFDGQSSATLFRKGNTIRNK